MPVILSHRHKFIFIKAHKVGGTSVEINLAKHCGPADIVTPITAYSSRADDTPYVHAPQNHKEQGLYKHIPPDGAKPRIGKEIWDEYLKVTIVRNPWDVLVSRYWWKAHGHPRKPFETYLRKQKESCNWSFYFWPDGSPTADLYMRYETLNDDYRALCERIGIPYAPLPVTKSKTRRDKRHYSTYYTNSTKNLAAQLCAQEIKYFGYQFET